MGALTVHAALVFALLSFSGTSSYEGNVLGTVVYLIELDYEDRCEQRAAATWSDLVGEKGALQGKLELDKEFGIFSRNQIVEIRSTLASNQVPTGDELLKRKVILLLEPGDTLLSAEQWIRLVTFGDTALHKIRFASDYNCGDANCTLQEFHKQMALQHDENTLLRMKQSWEKKLPDLKEYRENILPLLRNVSKEYNYTTVEEYWDTLAEYEGGLLKARELWDQVKPLYLKLQKYVSLRLKGEDAVGKPIPVHLLRSLSGEDWLNVIEMLLPQHPDIYQKLHANLQIKNYGGKELFAIAAKLLEELNFGPVEEEFWSGSQFEGTCPPTVVDSCKPNNVKVFTCKDVSIGNYLDAHEAVMRVKYKEIAASHSNNTYILREASRYSAIYEAMPGFASLLALTPHALDRAGLYPLDRFHYRNNQNHHRLVLQLIVALRDLPRLNYYLAADEWRLQVLMGSITSTKIASSWSEFRKNFSLIESSDSDLLGDPYVLLNKPFIGKFMGLILKYQIFHTFAEELSSDDQDLIDHVSQHNDRVMDTINKGYSVVWPEMIDDLLVRRESGLEYTGLTDYFKFLDEYLDNQLDPSNEYPQTEYEEPPEERVVENEIPLQEDKDEIPLEPMVELVTHDNINENTIEHKEDMLEGNGIDSSNVGVLEIKNQVDPNAAKENDIKEASYSTYWWIGIGVALAVVIIVIAIIARKRHNHRKQLDRQRENTHA